MPKRGQLHARAIVRGTDGSHAARAASCSLRASFLTLLYYLPRLEGQGCTHVFCHLSGVLKFQNRNRCHVNVDSIRQGPCTVIKGADVPLDLLECSSTSLDIIYSLQSSPPYFYSTDFVLQSVNFSPAKKRLQFGESKRNANDATEYVWGSGACYDVPIARTCTLRHAGSQTNHCSICVQRLPPTSEGSSAHLFCALSYKTLALCCVFSFPPLRKRAATECVAVPAAAVVVVSTPCFFWLGRLTSRQSRLFFFFLAFKLNDTESSLYTFAS